MNLTLYVWRQNGPQEPGRLERHEAHDVSPDMSFLEMLDMVNQRLIKEGAEPIAFDHDCREGICGACSLTINGIPHGGFRRTTVCQLHMRHFKDGDTIYIEPFRARAFPVLRDLVTDRSALDALVQAGGYISVNTGSARDANAILVAHEASEYAMDAAECIGCGACVAACPNGSAMLFTGAKVAGLARLPQGKVEARQRVCVMPEAMLQHGFGNCSNHYECEAACPKGLSVRFIAALNREYLKTLL